MPKPLEASVRMQGDGVEYNVAIIDLTGEIDAFGDAALQTAYTQADGNSPTAIVLNFAGVDYINSTGIALIVGILARARKDHRRLLTTGLSEHYQHIFTITRLSDFMTIAPDEAAALREVAAGQ